MNYTEAVQLAKDGNEAGYYFLYEETYQSKYYLALKYMQNEEEAKDILQDAYIKAFSKLETLDNPEKFAAWLGVIVANTAKNALKKKNPMLFADMVEDDKEEEIEYWLKDENVQNQPEIAYSQKETQELVHEIIDSLSEEQRMCILMYHIEERSISEIAGALGCSENTVKSRLNYGRKNIKIKAEELQKKGYKLYSVAPLPLLLYLLKTEQEVLAAEGAFKHAGSAMSEHIIKSVTEASVLKTAGAKVTSEVIKQGFMHTVAGKTVAAVVGITIITGSVVGVVVHNEKNNNTSDNVVLEQALSSNTETDEEEGIEQNVEQELVEQDVTEEQYASLLAGGLTKKDFEFVLSYGPQYMTESNPSIEDLTGLMFRIACVEYNAQFSNGETEEQLSLEGIVPDASAWVEFDKAEVNRFISVLTPYSFVEEDNDKYQTLKVSEDKVSIIIAEPANTQIARIQTAKLKGDEIIVEYKLESMKYDENGEEQKIIVDKTAVLGKLEDGTFRVIRIADSN